MPNVPTGPILSPRVAGDAGASAPLGSRSYTAAMAPRPHVMETSLEPQRCRGSGESNGSGRKTIGKPWENHGNTIGK
jgi:hypothetical protein